MKWRDYICLLPLLFKYNFILTITTDTKRKTRLSYGIFVKIRVFL